MILYPCKILCNTGNMYTGCFARTFVAYLTYSGIPALTSYLAIPTWKSEDNMRETKPRRKGGFTIEELDEKIAELLRRSSNAAKLHEQQRLHLAALSRQSIEMIRESEKTIGKRKT